MNARLDEFSSSVEALSLCISKLASALDVAAAGKAKRDQAVNALEDRVHQWQSDLSDAQTDDLVLPEVNFSVLPVAPTNSAILFCCTLTYLLHSIGCSAFSPPLIR